MTERQNAASALRRIANGERLPCTECGRVHELRRGVPTRQHYGSWADPDDGHPYREMTVQGFAQLALARESGARAVDEHADALRRLADA